MAMIDINASIENAVTAESMSALSKKGLCQTHREYEKNYGGVAKSRTQGAAYFRSRVIEDTIVYALLYDFRKKKDVLRYYETRRFEIQASYKMARVVNDAWNRFYIMRYLDAEKRHGTYAPKVNIEIKDRLYHSDASIMFVSGEDRDCVELIKFKCCKSSADDPSARNMQLYCMILAGRKLGFKKVKASFYYLAKEADGSSIGSCKNIFFSQGIISREDEGEKTDKEMEKAFEAVGTGIPFDDMEENSCTYCQTRHVCHYKKAPIPFKEDEEDKEKADTAAVPKKLFPLSSAQQKVVDAVNTFTGIILVNAGAGAGKTATITRAVKELIDKGADPSTIMLVTFTNNACKEMRDRLLTMIGNKALLLNIFTFNSLGNEILIKNWLWKDFKFGENPKLITETERSDIIKEEILEKHPIREWTGPQIKNFENPNSRQKSAIDLMADIYDYIRASELPSTSIQARDVAHITKGVEISAVAVRKIIDLYPSYEKFLEERGLYNYSDQIRMTLKFLEENEDYLEEEYGIRHFFIDEFQDTSEEQIDFVNCFTKTGKIKNLTLVGDDDQAIYGSFRNTSMEYIQNPEKYIDFPGGGFMKINLLDNYRCSANVINVSNIVVAKNKHRTVKTLNATRAAGARVTVKGFYRKKDEYEFIVEIVVKLISDGVTPEKIAIIAYTKAELLEITDLLTKKGIPVMYGAPEPLLENSRIIAIIEFAELIKEPDSTCCAMTAANAVMDGGLLSLSKEEIDEEIRKITGLAHAINEKETLEAKKALFYEFINMVTHEDEAVEYFKGLLDSKEFDEMLDFILKFKKYGGKEEYRRLKSYPGVCAITAHSSKGMEWPYVITTISKFATTSNMYEEEKRRLLFVTMTRAKDHLFVTSQFAAAGSTKEKRVINKFICEVMDANDQPYNIDFDAYDAMIKKQRLAAKATKAPSEKGDAKKSSKTGGRRSAKKTKPEAV